MSEERWQEILRQVRNNEITELDLISRGIENERASALAEALKASSSLTSLTLLDNYIGVEGAKSLAEALKENSSLTFMGLNLNKIGDSGARALAEALKENNSLTWLNLGNNNIAAEGARSLAEALKHNSSLTSLDLVGDNIGDVGSRALAEALKKNSSLTYLDLGFNNIGNKGARSLAEALKKNSSLTSLLLDGNKIGDAGARWLAEALKENSRLTSLRLDGNKIGDAGARWLAEALKINSTITYLNLWNNNIGEEGTRAIAKALIVNTSLTYLELGKNNIGYEGANDLAEALKSNNSLAGLNLFNNRIGEEGTRALAEALKVSSSLTSLNLQHNDIGEGGARWLAEALKENSSLTFLHLGRNKIGAEGTREIAEALTENNSLTSLNLDGNRIGDEGARALAEALKKNKCLSYYDGAETEELRNIVHKNKNDSQNLAKLINLKFNSYLKALRNGGSIDASRELNLEDLKQRSAAINYMLKEEDIGATPEIVLFFNIAFKKLQNSEESYNSTSGLFEAAMTELAIRLSEGYYEHPRDYPGLYIQDKLLEGKAYKISDEGKEKLLAIPAVLNYRVAVDMNHNRHYKFALKYINKALRQAPGEPRIMLEKVKILYLLGCFQQADETFLGALATDITMPDKLTETRDWFKERGEFDEAIALQEKLIKNTGDNSELAKLALLELENHNPSEAFETLDKLIEHEPKEFSAYQLKARMHYILADGGFDKVIKAGEKIALPKLAEYRQLADWLDKHEDASRAGSYSKKAAALERKIQGLKILQNWLQADNTSEFAGLSKLIEQINSHSIKHAKELDELEEVTELSGEFASNHTQLEEAYSPTDLLGINPELE